METNTESQLQIKPGTSIYELSNFEHAQRVAIMLSKSELIPKEYQNKVQNVMIALELSNRIGASPIMVMQNLSIIHGKPSWSSPFIISSINTCKKFTPLRFEIKGKGLDMECFAWANDLLTGDKIIGTTITMAMAKAEGWIDKAGSKWKTMPEQMIQYRSAAFFGRLYAPEILMGMQTIEEVIDVTHEVIKEDKEDREVSRMKLMILACETLEEVDELQLKYPHFDIEIFANRKEALRNG